ncbi:MAG: hypothetical protein ACYC37_01325 [Desulfobacteria bacterium]
MTAGVSRGSDNRLDMPFRLVFVERLYHGPARWFSRDWRRHHDRVGGEHGHRLDREPGVLRLMEVAHERNYLLNEDVSYWVGCVNPACTLRTWGLAAITRLRQESVTASGEARGTPIDPGTLPSLRREVGHGLKALAKGAWGDLRDECSVCGNKQPVTAVVPLQRRWVYILKEEGSALSPVAEIEIGTGATGYVRTRIRNGRFSDRPVRAFEGHWIPPRRFTEHTWHFFASPVRLGRQALDLLSNAPGRERDLAALRDRAEPAGQGVPVIPDMQPWATTVKRGFTHRQARTPMEYIPLVDPFAWCAQIADFDFLSIAAAQQKAVRDPDEQAKAFVAATLAQCIGRRQVNDNPPEFEEDAWDVGDDTVTPVPSEFSGSGNIARAWCDRYKAALVYLGEEANRSVQRLAYTLRFSLAHRIVELACQESEDPNDFGIGLTHWAHVLKDLMVCRAGQAFVTWLVHNGDARDRIPAKNVLRGERLGSGSPARQAIGPGLPLQILATLSPAVIAREENPAEAIVRNLEAIDIRASSFGHTEIQATGLLAVEIATDRLDKYIEHLPEGIDEAGMLRRCGANNWKERLESFGTIDEFDALMSLLTNLSKYAEEGRRDETDWDRFSRNRALVETPIKVAEYVTTRAQKFVKATMTEEAAGVAARLESAGLFALSEAELDVLISSRTVRAYSALGTGARVFAGPVGILIGGADLVVESGQTIDSWEGGDPGSAAAHGIQAAAAVLTIAVAGAECVALVSGAAAAAWAGPVGWIAAGLMLIGAAVMHFCSKNDLELFAAHSFLGPGYGDGDWNEPTGKAWMAGLDWPALRYERGTHREDRSRWERQRLALLRMLTGYTTYIGPDSYAGGIIFPGYVPNPTVFHIKVEVTPEGHATPREVYRAMIWPNAGDRDRSLWVGDPPGPESYIRVHREEGGVKTIGISAYPRGFRGSADYNFSVKLDLDGRGRTWVPASGDWIDNATQARGWGVVYREIASADVD